MTKKLLITVIVLMAFQDKFDHKTQYPEGAELKVDKERADDLITRGLAKIKQEEPPKNQADEKNSAAEPPVAGENKEQEEKPAPEVTDPEKKQEDEPGTEE